MAKKSKRMRQIAAQVDTTRKYSLDEAVALLQACPPVKFDQMVDLSMKLGVDPKKSDQQVRGTVSLPHGTGRVSSVLVFTTGQRVQEALDAGADHAGGEELADRIRGGWLNFDVVIATPDMMRMVGKLGKILGPRGLMPKTVTNDIASAVEDIKKRGKIPFSLDRSGVCNSPIGKLSFSAHKIVENARALLHAVLRAKPASAKGQYLVSIALSSTMGPGLAIERGEIVEAS